MQHIKHTLMPSLHAKRNSVVLSSKGNLAQKSYVLIQLIIVLSVVVGVRFYKPQKIKLDMKISKLSNDCQNFLTKEIFYLLLVINKKNKNIFELKTN